MTKATTKTASVNKPLIYRTARGKSLGRIASATTLEDRLDLAKLYAERTAQRAIIWQKVLQPLDGDVLAAEAAKRLTAIKKQISDLPFGNPPIGLATPPITINPDGTPFSPPYDHSEVGPDSGVAEAPSSADLTKGQFLVDASPANDFDGVFSAVAGLAIELGVSRAGTLEIDPYIQAHSQWHTDNHLTLDSFVEGHISLSVIDTTTEQHLVPPVTYQIFSQTVDGQIHSDDRVISAQYLNLSCGVQAGIDYQVWVHGYVTGNQSGHGNYVLDSSWAGGSIEVTIPFIWAKLT
jgi:hypothetical protein